MHQIIHLSKKNPLQKSNVVYTNDHAQTHVPCIDTTFDFVFFRASHGIRLISRKAYELCVLTIKWNAYIKMEQAIALCLLLQLFVSRLTRDTQMKRTPPVIPKRNDKKMKRKRSREFPMQSHRPAFYWEKRNDEIEKEEREFKNSLHMTRLLIFHSTQNSFFFIFHSLRLTRWFGRFICALAVCKVPCNVRNSIWSIAFVSPFYMHTHARKHFVSLASDCQVLAIQQNKQTHSLFLMEIALSDMLFFTYFIWHFGLLQLCQCCRFFFHRFLPCHILFSLM